MKVVALGEISEIQSGAGFPKKYQGEADGEIPFAKVGDIAIAKRSSGTSISVANNYVSVETASHLRAKIFPKNTIVFAKIGEAIRNGNKVIAQRPMAFDNNVMGVIPDTEKVDPMYLYRLLDSIDFYKLANSTTVPSIRKADMESLEVRLPPLDEQERVAAILDQADALRRLRQRAIDRINILAQAIFHEMFGDPKSNPKGFAWVNLGDVADFFSGSTLPDGEPFAEQKDGHLILKVSDLNQTRNQQNVVCAASWSASPGSRAGTCPPESLVFPKRGGAIGTNKKRWLRRSAILDPNLMGVHPDGKNLTISFLNGWFQTFNLSDIASGSSVPQLNKKDLAPLKVALPPVAEQLEYSRRMDALSSIRVNALNAASLDEALFSVLQHRAFRGEL